MHVWTHLKPESEGKTVLGVYADGMVEHDSMAGELLKGKRVGGRKVKVHLDGYNLMPALQGEVEWPRKEFLYWTDDGNVAGLRYNNWKVTFLRQNANGMHVWQAPYEQLRLPMIGNLRSDPFERAFHEDSGYPQWQFEHMYMFAPAGAFVGEWLQSSGEFSPRQKPDSCGRQVTVFGNAERPAKRLTGEVCEDLDHRLIQGTGHVLLILPGQAAFGRALPDQPA